MSASAAASRPKRWSTGASSINPRHSGLIKDFNLGGFFEKTPPKTPKKLYEISQAPLKGGLGYFLKFLRILRDFFQEVP